MLDDSRRILDLAEEKSLTLDEEVCRKARTELTTPNLRLAAELAWLPGLSPVKTDALISALQDRGVSPSDDPAAPSLVRINVMSVPFWHDDRTATSQFARYSAEKAADFILHFSHLVAAVDPEEVRRDINNYRRLSGFSEIQGIDQIEAELSILWRKYVDNFKEALNTMPPAALVESMARAVRSDTSRGEKQASLFLDQLVDVYQDETKVFLQGEIDKISTLLKSARALAPKGPAAVSPTVANLEAVVRNWVKVAEPIQLSLKSRGIDHDLSQQIAFGIRSLGVDLFNEHDFLDQSQRITKLLQQLFAYVPEVVARVDEDAKTIRSIAEKRERAADDFAEWARSITYQTEVGLLFKEKLAISPDGIEWHGKHVPLASISQVRWGGVSHSVNGIPTGSTYTIGVRDGYSETVISLKDNAKYSAFLACLWKAVCVRLMSEILAALRAGQHLQVGDVVLTDTGVTLTKHNVFAANERVFCDWSQIKIWSANGSFVIGSKSDKKVHSALPYLTTFNVHIVEQLIRLNFKTPSKTLSSLLEPG